MVKSVSQEEGGGMAMRPYEGGSARFLEAARELSPELEQRFGWLLSHIPELQPHLLTYTSERALLQYLELMRLDGMIETHADAMSALRLFSVELLAIVLGDFTAQQLKRMSGVGSLNDKEACRLRSMVDALQRLNKVATEMGAEAGFSKKSRHEMGVGRSDDLLEALRRIAAGDPIPEMQQMGVFLAGGATRSRPVEVVEGQFNIMEKQEERVLTVDELAELSAEEGEEET